MEPDQRKDLERRKEVSDKLSSLMAHPEWGLAVKLIDEERQFHLNKAHDPVLRRDNQLTEIARRMDAADVAQSILDKFDTALRLGKEAKEKLDKADGRQA